MTPAIFLTKIGHCVPSHKIDNSLFEELEIDTNAEWIADRVGILCRYSVLSAAQIKDLRHCRRALSEMSGEYDTIADLAEKAFSDLSKRFTRPEISHLICGHLGP